ncbi:gliding motility-associated C-terminal domain-containing protein [Aridibaculum aurantiacum]|uniref:T9SS type B sorting domain-containing protein n=1 Tax=Aridibaculum aurantiacum TaxID=2810307 RepID=UPI001A963B4B|nr:gliding motility-associated C-terminal domain-containing protein [Aridibaculum aurantiacum]
MFTRILLLCFSLCYACMVYGQGEFNNWYFGSGAGITFPGRNATSLTNGSMSASEGSATISDAAGNLLFYTDGLRIWNKFHQVMPNGNGLIGHPSTSQPAIIVPQPGSSTFYWVFTLTDQQGAGDLHYSIVDITLDGGKGDVVAGSKNIFLTSGLTEKIVAAKATICGIWILVHRRLSSEFIAYFLSSKGLQAPVFSNVGSTHMSPVGTMKVSADNKKIAVTQTSGTVEIIDFNPTTGLLSNVITITSPAFSAPYGACFSPDDSKLYVPEINGNEYLLVYQYDLSLATQAAIAGSKTYAGGASTRSVAFSDIQVGPDGKLYVARAGKNYLAIIPFPNLKAPQCGFEEDGVNLNGRLSGIGLPNQIRIQDSVLRVNLGPDTAACSNTAVILSAPAVAANFLWSTGAQTPSISVNTAGTYWLYADDGLCEASDTINISFGGKRVDLGPDTSICNGNTVMIDLGYFTSYQWHDNTTTPSYAVTAPGTIWLTATDHCGITSSDTLLIEEKHYPFLRMPDMIRCNEDSLHIEPPTQYLSYSWSPDYNISSLNSASVKVAPEQDTSYYLQGEIEKGCFVFDTVRVSRRFSQPIFLGLDTTICAGKILQLNAGSGFVSYRWSTGARRQYAEVEQRGNYWVEARDTDGCTSRDTISVDWDVCPAAIWVPTAFTPNGDGKNDYFKAMTDGAFVRFRLTVFSRWGEVIFSSNDPKRWWDGSFKGMALPTGAYVWTCDYQLYGDVNKSEKGMVTLLR